MTEKENFAKVSRRRKVASGFDKEESVGLLSQFSVSWIAHGLI